MDRYNRSRRRCFPRDMFHPIDKDSVRNDLFRCNFFLSNLRVIEINHHWSLLKLLLYGIFLFCLIENKAGYTATPVACGWAGTVMKKITSAFGKKQ